MFNDLLHWLDQAPVAYPKKLTVLTWLVHQYPPFQTVIKTNHLHTWWSKTELSHTIHHLNQASFNTTQQHQLTHDAHQLIPQVTHQDGIFVYTTGQLQIIQPRPWHHLIQQLINAQY